MQSSSYEKDESILYIIEDDNLLIEKTPITAEQLLESNHEIATKLDNLEIKINDIISECTTTNKKILEKLDRKYYCIIQ